MDRHWRPSNNVDYKLKMLGLHPEPAHKEDMTFPFLDLPAELRIMIYGYALSDRFIDLKTHRIERRDRHERRLLPPRLLQVNRQIREEASHIFYEGKHVIGTLESLTGWLDAKPLKASWVGSVVVQHVGCAACEHSHQCRMTVSQETAASPRIWTLTNYSEHLDVDAVPESCWRSGATEEKFAHLTEELRDDAAVNSTETSEERHRRDYMVLKRSLEFFRSSYEVVARPYPPIRRILASSWAL